MPLGTVLIIVLITAAYLLLWILNQLRAKRRAAISQMEATEAAIKHSFGQY